jgi:hypothetical protein
MPHRMVTYRMSFIQDSLVQSRVLLHILANHKKGCLYLVALERVQYHICNPWRRAIIKSEVNLFVAIGQLPNGVGPYQLKNFLAQMAFEERHHGCKNEQISGHTQLNFTIYSRNLTVSVCNRNEGTN